MTAATRSVIPYNHEPEVFVMPPEPYIRLTNGNTVRSFDIVCAKDGSQDWQDAPEEYINELVDTLPVFVARVLPPDGYILSAPHAEVLQSSLLWLPAQRTWLSARKALDGIPWAGTAAELREDLFSVHGLVHIAEPRKELENAVATPLGCRPLTAGEYTAQGDLQLTPNGKQWRSVGRKRFDKPILMDDRTRYARKKPKNWRVWFVDHRREHGTGDGSRADPFPTLKYARREIERMITCEKRLLYGEIITLDGLFLGAYDLNIPGTDAEIIRFSSAADRGDVRVGAGSLQARCNAIVSVMVACDMTGEEVHNMAVAMLPPGFRVLDVAGALTRSGDLYFGAPDPEKPADVKWLPVMRDKYGLNPKACGMLVARRVAISLHDDDPVRSELKTVQIQLTSALHRVIALLGDQPYDSQSATD